MSVISGFNARWVVLVAAVGGAATLGCGPVKDACNSTNCAGCCDERGFCQVGTVPTQCGVTGAACVACASDQLCTGGICIQYGVGGRKDAGNNGADGGTDDGGVDAGNDAGVDGGSDAGVDGGIDGGSDAGFDGGTDAGCKVNGSACTSGGQCCSEYCSGSGICGTPPPVDAGPWPGETCANPESISFSPAGNGTMAATVTASTQGYVNNGATGSCGGSGPDRVFAFTTSGTWDVQIDLYSPTGAQLAYSVRGPSCSAELTCNTSSQPALYPQVPAGTWYVWVDSDQSAGTPFALTVTLLPITYEGDSCSDALPVTFTSGVFQTSGDTTGYTNDISTVASGCSSATGGDVMYTFYNPGLADLAATVTTTSSTYRPSVYFLSGTCPASKSGTCGVADSGVQTATATLNAAPAGTYYVIVDGAVSTNGVFDLTVTRTPVSNATGESCSSPIPLSFTGTSIQTATVSGSTTSATHDHSHSCSSSTSSAPDRVYTFTTTTTKNFSATVTPSPSWDVGLSLFSSSCSTGELTCADAYSSSAETISYSSLPPGTYYLWIDGYSSSAYGSYSVSVTLQ